ncbi:hypothetical protein Tco_1472531 [Tanacetum coccineum]
MSDSEDSTVTYTAVSSLFGGLSDIGSPGVIGPEHEGLPWMLDDPYNEEVDIEADDEEEEEHPAPADSTAVALPAIDHAPSAEETKPFETDESAATPLPHPAYRVTARISIPAPVPTPVWSDAELARLLAISTPPPSPLSPWSSPLPQIPSPPLPVSSPIHVLSSSPPASPIRPLDAPSSGTPPLHLLSTDRRTNRPEVTLPPRKRLGIALGPRYEIRESSSAAAARLTGVTDVAEFSQMMTVFKTRVRQDTDEIYTRLDDEQSERQLMAGRLNMLYRDRRAHARTARLMETEAKMSREAWGRSIDASYLALIEVMSLRTQVVAQQAVITELQAADRRRQAVITEMLVADRKRQKQFMEALKLLKRLQTQMIEFERQQGPTKGPAQPELLEKVGSSSQILSWLVILYSLLSIMGNSRLVWL